MTGVDDMSTQDVFGYFKEYPPAHIEWIDDASCEYKYISDRFHVSSSAEEDIYFHLFWNEEQFPRVNERPGFCSQGRGLEKPVSSARFLCRKHGTRFVAE